MTFCFFHCPKLYVSGIFWRINIELLVTKWLRRFYSFSICSLKMTETGLAFSGGGIRSAAFSSGVLRRLLQRSTKIDYLSCVSGGGYTGSAYLEWKYRNNKVDKPEWHQKFFEQMKKQSGLMCNWQKPLQGVVDTLVIGNLRTTTTTLTTTTGSEIQCTAQARLADFVVVVSSTTPNTVQSRRPPSQGLAGINPLFLGDFLSVLCILLSL